VIVSSYLLTESFTCPAVCCVKVVELLLSKGANKEHRNISDYTPLSQAASGGFVNVIKVLLAHGAEINSRSLSRHVYVSLTCCRVYC